MKFNKPPLSLEEQLEHIETKYHLKVQNREEALIFLRHNNYYKIRGYWLYFEINRIEATFEDVIMLYQFDRKLRELLLSSLEIIETSIKTLFAYHLTTKYKNPHIHLDKSKFNNPKYYDESIRILKNSFKTSKEDYNYHYKNKYNEELPPLWVCIDFMTFGELSKWIRNLNATDTKQIASNYDIKSPKVFSSILYHFTEVRNRSAHNSRVWNSIFINRFSIPNRYKKVLSGKEYKLGHTLLALYDILYIIDCKNSFISDFFNLVRKDGIDLNEMGIDEKIIGILNERHSISISEKNLKRVIQ